MSLLTIFAGAAAHQPPARLQRIVEDPLHRPQRLDELELLAFGALAVDQPSSRSIGLR